MSSKKKGPLFIAFGNEEEEGATADLIINNLLFEQPHEYKNISYKEIPKKLSKINLKKSRKK